MRKQQQNFLGWKMGRKPSQKEQEEFINYLRSGRDEMNLLEHSISSASKEVDRSTRSLLFSREDRDPETGLPLTRSWDVSFSGKYGRPTSRDDDVFVACMKISSEANFASPRVEFTRYELCQILNWSVCGKSYKAIDDAFNRLAGVLIVATNYWYDNQAKIWVDRKFGVIEDVFLYQREKFDRAKRAAGGKNPQSWFRWSDVMQESFAAGYIRKLDLEVYLSLENPVARKLYRYLGKHFWNRSRHAIELQQLCHEKLGYSLSEKRNPRLRQKIEPAIQELEEKGIYGLSHEFNASYGKCEVVFSAKAKSNEKRKEKSPASPILEKLVAIGVEKRDALDAIGRLTPQRILEDIEHVEFEAKAGRVKSSKAGMLAKMLKEGEPWGRPQGFVSSVKRAELAKAKSEKDKAELLKKNREEELRRQAEATEKAEFMTFFEGLGSKAKREEFQEQALQAESFFRQFYKKALAEGSHDTAEEYLHAAMRSHWRKVSRPSTTPGAVQKSIRF